MCFSVEVGAFGVALAYYGTGVPTSAVCNKRFTIDRAKYVSVDGSESRGFASLDLPSGGALSAGGEPILKRAGSRLTRRQKRNPRHFIGGFCQPIQGV
jgi:hypothetical protein